MDGWKGHYNGYAGRAGALYVVYKVMESSLRQAEAAEMLSLSYRQVGRIAARVREEGPQAVETEGQGKHFLSSPRPSYS